MNDEIVISDTPTEAEYQYFQMKLQAELSVNVDKDIYVGIE